MPLTKVRIFETCHTIQKLGVFVR